MKSRQERQAGATRTRFLGKDEILDPEGRLARAMLEEMKQRDTRKNIRNIREEIKKVNISTGITKNLSSVTKINE